MFAILGFIHAEPWAEPSYMTRWRCVLQSGYGTDIQMRLVFGRPALFVRHLIPEGLSVRRSAARQRELLRLILQSGVDKLAFSASGVKDVLDDFEVSRMDSDYLHMYLAGDVGACVADRTGTTAALFFRSVGQIEERVILKLAKVFRYLMIHAGRDSMAVCRALRQRYGVPVVELPTARQIFGADFALVCAPLRRDVVFSERCLTFAPSQWLRRLVPGGRSITRLGLDIPQMVLAEIPSGFSPLPILSEAAFRGQVDPGKIKIHSLSIDKAG